MAKTNKINCEKETQSIKQEIKKERSFNVKAWLIASTFSILSCCLGLANLIIHFVDK